MTAPAFRAFASPRVYIQGPGVLDQLAGLVSRLGRAPVAIVDANALKGLQGALQASLGPASPVLSFQGFVTGEAIAALAARAGAADVVVAAGGGRAIDAGKGVAIALKAALIVVPTIASSDAATSHAAVVHDAQDDFVEVRALPWNPDAVLVDTAVIAEAPARFLRWGIGDALSKVFEAGACQAAGGRNSHGGAAPIAALALAQACYDVLRRDAVPALAAAERHVLTPELENIVEAALLLSGLGFESGGLSIAHTVALALAAAPSTRDAAHGEQVGYGLLVQLALDPAGGGPLRDIWTFLGEVGLPRRLAALTAAGANGPDIAELSAHAARGLWAHNYPAPLTPADFQAAIETVERLR